MNKYEFIASSYLLHGGNWKKDIAETLCFSADSKGVNKILSGKRIINDGISTDIVNALKKKAQAIVDAVAYLENPEKIVINTSEFEVLTFDQYGVRQFDMFQGADTSDFTVCFRGELYNKSQYDIEFISLIISAAAQDAYRDGNNAKLIEAINHYFDLQFLNIDLNEFYIEVEQEV